MSMASLDLDVFKDIPGYKGILKAVLKYQIQLLVEQLSEHGGEESVLLSANVSEGTLSHLGTEAGKGFVSDNNDVKRQYLSYCLKKHHTEKRKTEFLSQGQSQEEVQPVKMTCAAPESVVSFPVHKKPYFRAHRRHTRIRSGSKQFSSAFSKGMNQFAGQRLGGKVVPHGGYLMSRENESGKAYQGQIMDNVNQSEALNLPYEGQRLDEEGQVQSNQVVVKTEIQTDDNVEGEENAGTQNEGEVTVIVKVEPPDDETGDRVSRVISEDIQTFGDASMESEESFSEGNQSFEYLLDLDNSTDIITPWKPEENDKLSQVPSKRKQMLPTRITKSGDATKATLGTSLASNSSKTGNRDTNSPGIFSHTSQSYGGKSANQTPGNSDWFGSFEEKRNMNQKTGTSGFAHVPVYRDKNQGNILNQQTFGNVSDLYSQRSSAFGAKSVAENMYSRMQSSVWTQEQILNLSADNTAKGGSYSDKVGDRSGLAKGVEMTCQEESYQPGGMKTYMKTPQIDGLFVSRGEGRYEKLIKCEECGKVCRTSNMARHKKRYCTALPKVVRTRKNYCPANEYISVKDMPLECTGSNIYVDNPERQAYSIDLTDPVKDLNVDSVNISGKASLMESIQVDSSPAENHSGVFMNTYMGNNGNLGTSLPRQMQESQSSNVTNILNTHSPPSTNLMQDKFKKRTKSDLPSQFISTDQNKSDVEISKSDFEFGNVYSESKTSASVENNSNKDLKKAHNVLNNTTYEPKASAIDVEISESQLSEMVSESSFIEKGGSRNQRNAEEMSTDDVLSSKLTEKASSTEKENLNDDFFQSDVHVKQEPANFDNM